MTHAWFHDVRPGRTRRGALRRLLCALGVAVLASSLVASPAAAGPAAPAARTIKILQMNLCNSGHADSCYSGGEAIDEAKTMIFSLERPTVVFLNEVCRGDEREIAWNGNYDDYPAILFTATNVKCTNGADYGSAILVDNNYNYAGSSGLFTAQDGTSERRAYGCARFADFFGCVTHLSTDEPTALRQCNELTKQRLPAFQSSLGEPSVPAIVGGDLNLEYATDDPENVQNCVPSGWTRKGDGDVQHVMVSSGFSNMSAETYWMTGTDHNALEITVTAPW